MPDCVIKPCVRARTNLDLDMELIRSYFTQSNLLFRSRMRIDCEVRHFSFWLEPLDLVHLAALLVSTLPYIPYLRASVNNPPRVSSHLTF